MAARGATFASPVDNVLAMGPGISTGYENTEDIPLFKTIETNQIYGYDMHNNVARGLTPAPTTEMLNTLGGGKTTTLMQLLYHLINRKGLFGNPYKVVADNNRRNFMASEWDTMCNYADCKPTIFRERRFNPLHYDLNLTFAQTLDLEELMLSTARNLQFNDDLSEMLLVATWFMYNEHREDTSWELLAYILRRLEWEDVVEVRNQSVGKLQQLRSVSGGRFGNRDLKNDTRDLLSVCNTLAGMVDMFVHGKFGDTLGGTDSIVPDMQQQFFLRDFSGLGEGTTLLLHLFFSRVNSYAIVNNDFRLQPDAIFSDEAQRNMRYKPFARASNDENKYIRGSGKWKLYAHHQWEDWEGIGTADSEERNLAMSMKFDTPNLLVGRQGPTSIVNLAKERSLSEADSQFLATCGRGEWLSIIGDNKPVRVMTLLTDRVRKMTRHDIASETYATIS